jgi:glycosyltransferase involved in cell wall biosynthesis
VAVPRLTATIITLNESADIGAALAGVSWVDEVIVVDAGSVDDTVEIARRTGARVETRPWSGYVDQKNFASDLASNDWILSLDADERVPPALAAEIRALLAQEPSARAYRMPRVAFHLGRWFRTTDFYPDPQIRLYDRRTARWQGRYVHESVAVHGSVGRLTGELQHYPFRDLSDHVDRMNRYAALSARQMYEAGRRVGPAGLLVRPAAAFIRNYLLRRGMLDGTAGLTLSLVNAGSVFVKYATLWEMQAVTRARDQEADSRTEAPVG